ncbi:hypothetical protein [Streptomyces javensis]|uniref:hypothetical protein n=1 Tax=Streptomyces javensis TaxID=114698 RepID=UPI0018DC9242|nr:hypothetical protein [Streptomyces javensis]
MPTNATVIPLRPAAPASAEEPVGDQQVAAFWEGIFLRQGRTLRDPSTAECHRITAATFGLLINGARDQGVLSEDQAEYLAKLAVEAVRAPDFLPAGE